LEEYLYGLYFKIWDIEACKKRERKDKKAHLKRLKENENEKEELIDCIETLLGDNTTLVLGSAIAAFSEVCPERIDLLHPHFRKFCNMLADIDEWGQISVVNILTRYSRTQFGNPNPNEVCSFLVQFKFVNE